MSPATRAAVVSVGNPVVIPLAAGLALWPAVSLATRVSPGHWVVVAVLLVTLAQWLVLARVARQVVPLPGLLLAGLNIAGVLGWLYYPQVAATAAVSATLPDTAGVYNAAARVFVTASLMVWLGALAGYRLTRPRVTGSTAAAVESMRAYWAELPLRVVALAAPIPLLLLVIAYTPAGLLERSHYSEAAGPALARPLAVALVPVGVAATALFAVRARGLARVGAGALFAAYVVVIFATGSRSLTFAPVMLTLAWFLIRGAQARRLQVAVRVVAGLIATVVALSLPITLRGATPYAGLRPYLAVISADPHVFYALDLGTVAGNILFAVPLTGVTSRLPGFPLAWLGTSVTPAPGGWTDWGTVRWSMRLNAYTPTNGLGELANWGVAALVLVMAVIGFALAALQCWNARMRPGLGAAALVVGFGITVALALALLQYNLRNGVRFVWYFLLISLVLHAIGRFRGTATSDAGAGPG